MLFEFNHKKNQDYNGNLEIKNIFKKERLTADYFIKNLKMEPHIEGGYCKEVYKNDNKINTNQGERPLSSTIYYLLKENQVSVFHQLQSDELWFYHKGSPLKLYMIDSDGNLTTVKLGLDILKGEVPQIIVPKNTIFGAEVEDKNSFAFFSCMVSPGFSYDDCRIIKRESLMEMYTQHNEIIFKLTK